MESMFSKIKCGVHSKKKCKNYSKLSYFFIDFSLYFFKKYLHSWFKNTFLHHNPPFCFLPQKLGEILKEKEK